MVPGPARSSVTTGVKVNLDLRSAGSDRGPRAAISKSAPAIRRDRRRARDSTNVDARVALGDLLYDTGINLAGGVIDPASIAALAAASSIRRARGPGRLLLQPPVRGDGARSRIRLCGATQARTSPWPCSILGIVERAAFRVRHSTPVYRRALESGLAPNQGMKRSWSRTMQQSSGRPGRTPEAASRRTDEVCAPRIHCGGRESQRAQVRECLGAAHRPGDRAREKAHELTPAMSVSSSGTQSSAIARRRRHCLAAAQCLGPDRPRPRTDPLEQRRPRAPEPRSGSSRRRGSGRYDDRLDRSAAAPIGARRRRAIRQSAPTMTAPIPVARDQLAERAREARSDPHLAGGARRGVPTSRGTDARSGVGPPSRRRADRRAHRHHPRAASASIAA